MEKRSELITTALGKTKEILLPSGNIVVIREQNGEDDTILTNAKDSAEGISFDKFICSIVISSKQHGDKAITLADIKNMRLRDKYAILFESRIFSLGGLLTYQYIWGEKEKPVSYEEDLTTYIWDYTKPFPQEGDENYFEYRIEPYPENVSEVELELQSGKVIKFNFLNGESEIYLSTLTDDVKSINSQLIARDIKIKGPDGAWVKIHNFRQFSSRDMMEIRSAVKKYDSEFQPFSEIEHPTNGKKAIVNLTVTLDFFLPVLI